MSHILTIIGLHIALGIIALPIVIHLLAWFKRMAERYTPARAEGFIVPGKLGEYAVIVAVWEIVLAILLPFAIMAAASAPVLERKLRQGTGYRVRYFPPDGEDK